MRVTRARVKAELRKRMHQSIPEQGHWLQQVVRGYFATQGGSRVRELRLLGSVQGVRSNPYPYCEQRAEVRG